MLVTAALLLTAAVVVLALGWGALRHERVDETERFHRAREITSSWAEPGPRLLQPVPDVVGTYDAPSEGTQPNG